MGREVLEILYVSIAVVTGYRAQLVFRHAGPGARAYAFLLLADGALAALAVIGGHADEPSQLFELVGAASLFGFVGLVMVPPFLRDLTRRALARERLGVASWLARLRELLSPGLGGRQERELIDVIRALRGGDVEGAIAAVRTRRAAAEDPRERAALDDRLVFMLLSASRHAEAVREYERAREAGAPPSIALAVEMVRAYGELGDLERAGEIVAWVSSLPGANEPALGYFVARARLLFLAYAGRVDAVEAALGARGAPLASMPDAARAYWTGTARHFAGDADGARAALERAVTMARRDTRGRALAVERLGAAPPPPRALTPEVERLLAEAADAAVRPLPEGPPVGLGTRATTILVAVNLAVFALVSLLLGSTDEPWVLARAGANLKSAAAAEPWRLLTSTFLHADLLHLGVNVFGLWVLGRFYEPAVGWLRFTALYGLSAVCGSLASVLAGGAGMSVGASGAIFGILGASIAELAIVRRRTAAPAWRSAVTRNLLFIAVAQLAIGWYYPRIDQSAHIGGLVAGALAALLLSPGWAPGRSRLAAALATLLFGAFVAGSVAAAALTATTRYTDTIARVGWERRTLGGVSVELPRGWLVEDDGAAEPAWFLSPTLTIEVVPASDAGAVSKLIYDKLAHEAPVAELAPVAPSLSPPPGWSVTELRFTYGDAVTRLAFRKWIFTRIVSENEALSLTLLVPEARTADGAALVPRILGSVRPAAQS